MKISGMFLLAVTTLLLVTTTIFASLNLAFGWIFLLTVLGQVLFLFTVYKILRDDYSTDKTFADFYEDRPVQKNQ
tara:strand:+ start:47488 stop:47712 length:225 start_codon:yes stop_codon:yes gene_type:complete